jgi:hypothetical protein
MGSESLGAMTVLDLQPAAVMLALSAGGDAASLHLLASLPALHKFSRYAA